MISRLIVWLLFTSLGASTMAQQFTAYLPKSGVVTDQTTPHFFWNEVDGATDYQLQIAADANFTQNLLTFNTSNLDFELTAPLSFDDYFWRVEATTPIGNELTPAYELTIFSPAQLNDLSLWLRPDLGVTLDGNNKVESWNDQSNNGFPLAQASGSKRPEVNPNGLNGLPSMQFNGGQVLDGGNILNIGTGSRSMFVVGNHTTSGTGNFFAKALAAGANSRYAMNIRTANELNNLFHDNMVRNIPLTSNQNPSISSIFGKIINRNNNTLLSLWNKENNTSNIAPGFNMNSTFRFLIGAYNDGTDLNEINFLNGSISEIIFFDNVDSIIQQKIINYLRYRYIPELNLGPDIRIPYSICINETLDAGSGFQSYLWSDGSTGQTLTVTAPGKYWVEALDQFGFVSSDTIEVIAPSIAPPPSQLYCAGDVINWDTQLGPDYDYLWSDGSTNDNLIINTSGNFSVQVTDSFGCTVTSNVLFFDEDPFPSLVSLGPDQSLCSGNSIALISGDSAIVSYQWSTGATTPSIVLATSGTYTLDVVNDNGCPASDQIQITILGDAPVMDITVPIQTCVGEEFTLIDQSFTTDGSTINQWAWNFGDGNTANTTNTTHSYQAAGNYDVTLEVFSNSGCGNQTQTTIEVLENPIVAIAASNFCQGNIVNFNANQNTSLPINDWFWDFGDTTGGNTSIDANTQHIYGDYGAFEVMLVGTDVNGCVDTATQIINILPAPQVAFDFTEVCVGDIVQFQNQTTIGGAASVTSYLWNFGDGTTTGQVNPAKPYLNPGNFEITLNALGNNGCTGTATAPLKVHDFPVPSIQIDPLCADVPGSMSDQSFVPNGSVATAEWVFSDGQELSGLNIAPVFQNPGNYNVTVTVGSAFGCESSIIENFSVSDFITASFTTDPLAILAEFPTTFTSTSSGESNYSWIINDTINSEDPSVVVTFDSTQIGEMITITLTTENALGCTATTTQEMEVLRRSTDLALNEIFAQDSLGFYVVGVEMENKGTTPITQVDFFLRTGNGSTIKEAWHGVLQAGEKKNFVFSSAPSTVIDMNKAGEYFICIEGQIISAEGFEDEDLSNNRICKNVSTEAEPVILMPYPNPVSEVFTLRIVMPQSETVTVQIFNNLGQMQTEVLKNEELPAGLTEIPVNAAKWSAGSYHIHLISTSVKKNAKLMVYR